MSDAPWTGDLDFEQVHTREDLAVLLRKLHARADSPPLRELAAWAVTNRKASLAKATVSDMLGAKRLPKKATMLAFVQACGIPLDEQTPWRHAWERVASNEQDRPSLDTELSRLREDAQVRADQLVDDARAQAQQIIAASQQQVERHRQEIAVLQERAEQIGRHIHQAEQRLRQLAETAGRQTPSEGRIEMPKTLPDVPAYGDAAEATPSYTGGLPSVDELLERLTADRARYFENASERRDYALAVIAMRIRARRLVLVLSGSRARGHVDNDGLYNALTRALILKELLADTASLCQRSRIQTSEFGLRRAHDLALELIHGLKGHLDAVPMDQVNDQLEHFSVLAGTLVRELNALPVKVANLDLSHMDNPRQNDPRLHDPLTTRAYLDTMRPLPPWAMNEDPDVDKWEKELAEEEWLEALTDVVWSEGTRWPVSIAEQMTERSYQIAPDYYRVRKGTA
ncbi:hypothetical protein ACIBF1_44320 [Spirillospora sp. NPDC050679]